ncbi:hypothetical protein HDC90_001160 [Pedobacter sp. AK013]|nr:hypothetical protein [Pedobacter sp. AK013]
MLKLSFFVVILLVSTICLCGCEKKACPEGMHELRLKDGTTICVPNNL